MVTVYYNILNSNKLSCYQSHNFKVTFSNKGNINQNGNNAGSDLSIISAKLLSSSVNL